MKTKIFADTNWLVAAYLAVTERTVLVERVGRKYEGLAWHITPPVLMETRVALARESGEAHSAEWKRICGDLGHRLMLEGNWPALEKQTAKLADRYAHKGTVGTFDLFVLAGVLHGDATHFFSFDTGSNLRALATLEKLETIPVLTPDDKQRMGQFR